MDFLNEIFRSAFSGHDFSVLIFGSVIFLLLCVQAVLLLTALLDLSDEQRVPRWGWVTLVVIPLVIGALGFFLYTS